MVIAVVLVEEAGEPGDLPDGEVVAKGEVVVGWAVMATAGVVMAVVAEAAVATVAVATELGANTAEEAVAVAPPLG